MNKEKRVSPLTLGTAAFKSSPFDWPAALTSYAGKGCDKESSENILYKGW